MSQSDVAPASIPLLFPDPGIEFYLEKVDRAPIREQLKKTPGERLACLEEKVRDETGPHESVAREDSLLWPAKKTPIDMGLESAWFAEAKAVPMLVPDPVIESCMEDVDRGLIRQALRLSVSQRFDRFQRLMRSAYELRRACRLPNE